MPLLLTALLPALLLQQSLKPVTFSVSGFSCESCAKSVKARLAQVKDVHGVVVTFADRRARMEIDAEKMPLQRLATAISGEAGQFTPRVLMKVGELSSFSKLKDSLLQLKGIRMVRDPNSDGLFLVDLRSGESTTLADLYRAAEQAQITISDAPVAASKTH
ncbi:MAG: cation transporter [Fimbriimonas sp.]